MWHNCSDCRRLKTMEYTTMVLQAHCPACFRWFPDLRFRWLPFSKRLLISHQLNSCGWSRETWKTFRAVCLQDQSGNIHIQITSIRGSGTDRRKTIGIGSLRLRWKSHIWMTFTCCVNTVEKFKAELSCKTTAKASKSHSPLFNPSSGHGAKIDQPKTRQDVNHPEQGEHF